MNFIWLLFAHFIGDWGLQSQFMSKYKSKYWLVMFAHGMTYTGVIALTLQWLGILEIWKLVFIFVGHYAMDYIKGKLAHSERDWWMIYPDHILHIVQLGVICLK